jgi:hypothetical protein
MGNCCRVDHYGHNAAVSAWVPLDTVEQMNKTAIIMDHVQTNLFRSGVAFPGRAYHWNLNQQLCTPQGELDNEEQR